MKQISAIVLGLAIAVLALSGALVAQQGTAAPAAGQQNSSQMMAQRQKMMAEMQAQQKKLDALVAQMNSATGAAKVDRVADVLNELVAQHNRMSTMMMQGNMMMMPGAPSAPAPATPPAGGKTEPDHSQHH